jgi:hypothetical protein
MKNKILGLVLLGLAACGAEAPEALGDQPIAGSVAADTQALNSNFCPHELNVLAANWFKGQVAPDGFQLATFKPEPRKGQSDNPGSCAIGTDLIYYYLVKQADGTFDADYTTYSKTTCDVQTILRNNTQYTIHLTSSVRYADNYPFGPWQKYLSFHCSCIAPFQYSADCAWDVGP